MSVVAGVLGAMAGAATTTRRPEVGASPTDQAGLVRNAAGRLLEVDWKDRSAEEILRTLESLEAARAVPDAVTVAVGPHPGRSAVDHPTNTSPEPHR